MDNIIKPCTKNKGGRTLFYIFEIASVAFFAIMFIAGIVVGALSSSFLGFFQYFMVGTVLLFAMYGLGRIIDLLYTKNECNCDDNCDCGCKDKD